jgi:PAS domain S-box-containing protein
LHSFSFHSLQDENVYGDFAYCLSFASDESDFKQNFAQVFPDERMQEQLAISKNQLRNYGKKTVQKISSVVPDSEPLPRTIQDALRRSSRAIVITEAVKPFRIVDVNKAWEDLCGYSYVEAKGKTLGSLLRGPETDALAATALIAQLLRGEEAGATLTNYTKDNRSFRNRLQVGPLMEGSDVTHFVGVLQEV